MISKEEILKKYWGFSSFREPQEAIIDTVLQKKDVIALLPTGSGKSICYQIPGLILEGVCLVISPLLALMQDQIKSLEEKNIKATYIKPKSSQSDIIDLFDNIKYGEVKFLYLSPERLQSTFIQQKIKELQISLIAVDEAHCISEWGHDFRPSYRKINKLRELFDNINFIALTATADKRVLDDIEKNLKLEETLVYRKSFYKKNLAYQVFDVEDKLTRLELIFKKTKTPAIVYANSRKKTEELSVFLNERGFKSDFYHAGLSDEQKKIVYKNWMSEQTPIIIATNAFGMGIDKSNVGIVIHFDIPISLENYVQESGRAGRNGKKAYAVLLKNNHDIMLFKERFFSNILTLKEVKIVHQKLYQFFNIAYGEILNKNFPFSISQFSKKYNFSKSKVNFVLQILANNNIILLSNNFQKKSTIQFKVSSKIAINYTIKNIYIKNFIDLLLRSYTGLFKQGVNIDEFLIAKKNNTTSYQVKQYLQQLHNDNILEYKPKTSETEIEFLVPREDDRTINIHAKEIEKYIAQKKQKFESFLSYLENNNLCRSIQILKYFDEKSIKKCGICDVCLSQKKLSYKNIEDVILAELENHKKLSSVEIISILNINKKQVLIHLQHLLAEEKISIDYQNKYHLNL